MMGEAAQSPSITVEWSAPVQGKLSKKLLHSLPAPSLLLCATAFLRDVVCAS
jgi:hypothetical protein